MTIAFEGPLARQIFEVDQWDVDCLEGGTIRTGVSTVEALEKERASSLICW